MYRCKSIAPTAMSLNEKRLIRPTLRTGQLQHHLSELALSSCLHDMKRRKHRELSLNTKAMLMLILLIGEHPPEPAEGEVLVAEAS